MKRFDARVTWERAGHPSSTAATAAPMPGISMADWPCRPRRPRCRCRCRFALRPAIAFAGARQPDAQEIAAIDHLAHERCYIANSLNTEIVVLETC